MSFFNFLRSSPTNPDHPRSLQDVRRAPMTDDNNAPISLKVKSKRIPAPVATAIKSTLNWLMGIHRFNAAHSRVVPCDPRKYGERILDHLNITVRLEGVPIDRVPNQGPQIWVSNHPYGLFEACALGTMLDSKRRDSLAMSVFALGEIPEIRDRLLMVDPSRSRKRRSLNAQSWRGAYRLLADRGALLVFPAGTVSSFDTRTRTIRDREWSKHIATLARRTDATVVPFFVHGHNSLAFQLAGIVSHKLQESLIFGAFTKLAGKEIRISMGDPISPETLQKLDDDEEAIQFLRQKVYDMAR